MTWTVELDGETTPPIPLSSDLEELRVLLPNRIQMGELAVLRFLLNRSVRLADDPRELSLCMYSLRIEPTGTSRVSADVEQQLPTLANATRGKRRRS
jgi:hypothetical protein